ncbi:hypothetical protein [Halostella litorea]|uniref:hypothetical protein n=1 Tax=Halostella litorea TaxID=2528831 RepID=UPI001091E3DC|nr:hypothetical protein [Halostella litorea]
MSGSELLAFVRADPGRAFTYSVLPVLVAVAQLANSLVHGVPALYPGLFALALVAFAAVATQYHLAAHRVDEAWSPTSDQPAD